MPTPPDDVDALFGLPPLPASPPPVAVDIDAAEAALAAEFAAELAAESGGLAIDAPDSRTGLRVNVAWPARLRLPDGRVLRVQVRNVSESGVGLTGDEPIPAGIVADFEMDVPPLAAGGAASPVKGTITVAHGAGTLCGGTWAQVPAAGLALVNQWTARLRG